MVYGFARMTSAHDGTAEYPVPTPCQCDPRGTRETAPRAREVRVEIGPGGTAGVRRASCAEVEGRKFLKSEFYSVLNPVSFQIRKLEGL